MFEKQTTKFSCKWTVLICFAVEYFYLCQLIVSAGRCYQVAL